MKPKVVSVSTRAQRDEMAALLKAAHAVIRTEPTLDKAVAKIRNVAPPINGLPDPFAQQVWESVSTALLEPALSIWQRVQTPVAFVVWSAACFSLGRLV